MPLGAPFLAHAGIEHRVEHVHDQVHEDGRHDDEQQDAIRQRVILALDRLKEGVADARIGEDDFDEQLRRRPPRRGRWQSPSRLAESRCAPHRRTSPAATVAPWPAPSGRNLPRAS